MCLYNNNNNNKTNSEREARPRRPRWHGHRRGARSLVSADRARHVDFFVKDWVRGGVYV